MFFIFAFGSLNFLRYCNQRDIVIKKNHEINKAKVEVSDYRKTVTTGCFWTATILSEATSWIMTNQLSVYHYLLIKQKDSEYIEDLARNDYINEHEDRDDIGIKTEALDPMNSKYMIPLTSIEASDFYDSDVILIDDNINI